jgi:predicted HTH domain antitoxin
MSAEKVKVDLNISNDLIPLIEDLGLSKSLNDNITISIAIALFTSRSVSLARAAEIAEMELADFMTLLKNKNIPWSEYTEDEFRLDEIALKDFKDELGESTND